MGRRHEWTAFSCSPDVLSDSVHDVPLRWIHCCFSDSSSMHTQRVAIDHMHHNELHMCPRVRADLCMLSLWLFYAFALGQVPGRHGHAGLTELRDDSRCEATSLKS